MSIEKYYKIISPRAASVDITDGQDIGGNRGLYGNYTWYHRLVQGSANRIVRYREYDIMDNDIDVARALDIIAQEMTGNSAKTDLPLEINVTAGNEQTVQSRTLVTLHAALTTWCKIQNLDIALYGIARNLVKYGDTFFFRPKKTDRNKKWKYVNPKHVVGAVVSEQDLSEIRGWHIKTDAKKVDGNVSNLSFNTNGNLFDYNVEVFNADDVIRFTTSNEMSEEAPFGESILVAVYRTFKQKELLEDSIIIYRIVRAPERKAFYINMGNMSATAKATHLEQIKNEINQRKIPTMQGGKNQIESIYNPQSMMENYFFAVDGNGNGSRVESIPGGQNLGELEDLQYFYKRMWRGLRVPQSYIDSTSEGGAPFNDGKVGIAYIQEIKFAQYVERLQKFIEVTLDKEFKRFLYEQNIIVDPTVYRIVLPSPTNCAKSRQNSIDSELITTYGNVKEDNTISKRYAKLKYLGWSKDELIMNERMLREEKGMKPDGGKQDLPKLYFPDEAEAGGFEGGLGGGGGGGAGGSDSIGNVDEGDFDEDIEAGGEESAEGDEDITGEAPGTEAEAPNTENEAPAKKK